MVAAVCSSMTLRADREGKTLYGVLQLAARHTATETHVPYGTKLGTLKLQDWTLTDERVSS